MRDRVLCPRCLTDNDDEPRCRKCGGSLNLAMLHVGHGEIGGETLVLRPRSYTIGRSPEAALVLADPSISRVHAVIGYRREGFFIEDRGSRHGVYVDAVKVKDAPLTSGCTIQVGSVMLRFSLLNADASTADGLESSPAGRPRSGQAMRRMPSEWAADTLDQLELGVVLVNPKGKVAFANRSARTILEEADGLMLAAAGDLYVSDSATAKELRELLASASAADGRRGGVLPVPRPSGRRPLTLLVTRLGSDAREGLRRVRAVFISDPERGIATGEETLVRLHGLTRTEAALAVEILQGKTMEAAAAELGITVQTARSHLKRVFAKTKTRRQSELVLLLLKTAPPLRSD
jgi:DNA-binding CsgD family transcriptional regulator